MVIGTLHQPPIAYIALGFSHAVLTQGMYATPAGLFQMQALIRAASSSSLPPPLRIGLRSLKFVSKRQASSLPSEVSLILSQSSQNGSVMGVITPSSPLPSSKPQREAVSPCSLPFAIRLYFFETDSRISFPLTILSTLQSPSPSRGMNSMNLIGASISLAKST